MDTNDTRNSTMPTTPGQRPDMNTERSGRFFAGIIVVIVGALLLARQVGADVPSWILSGGTLLIAIGVYMGVKQRFRNWVWMVPTGIGALLLADRLIPDFSIRQYIWPIIVIAVGLVLIFRPKRSRDSSRYWSGNAENTAEDSIDSTTIFGAIKKNIISKDFKGGEATSIFGGVELNLGQADINGRANLELTHIFGGAKLIIPANWTVKTDEMVCIFGGLDDKRKLSGIPADPNKVLVINGTCIFGGIDIKSY